MVSANVADTHEFAILDVPGASTNKVRGNRLPALCPSFVADQVTAERNGMLRNYMVVALRNLVRHKLYSAINILGLAVGMACSILMLVYVRHELSYDGHHQNADRIFSVIRDDIRGAKVRWPRRVSGALPLAMKDTFAEVEQAIRLRRTGSWVRSKSFAARSTRRWSWTPRWRRSGPWSRWA